VGLIIVFSFRESYVNAFPTLSPIILLNVAAFHYFLPIFQVHSLFRFDLEDLVNKLGYIPYFNSWTPVLMAGEGLNMNLFYRRTNRLLGRNMKGIRDSSSTGWRRSNMTLFYRNQQAAGEDYGRDPGLQFYWLEKV
jgi:hypothetical protein